MHGFGAVDEGKMIDWGQTSPDYAAWRPGPPIRLYSYLATFNVGLKDQAILDLGTGTGVVARQFCQQGATVCGIDISEQQVTTARLLAQQQGLDIEFVIASAEQIPYPDNSFDVVTANLCWLYFDADKAIPEVKRVLRKGGVLVTSHFYWLPRLDPIARATEQLVLEFNPSWSAADTAGKVPACPYWAKDDFEIRAMFYFDEAIPFSRESWCGRIRACRGVGASLDTHHTAQFDQAHLALLNKIAPGQFTIRHRIDAHILGIAD
jgi:SAM-dependent methyltransferase